MPVGAGFQAFVLDLLAPLQPGARRMFGGVGIMRDGLMFALLSNDTMYFRSRRAHAPLVPGRRLWSVPLQPRRPRGRDRDLLCGAGRAV